MRTLVRAQTEASLLVDLDQVCVLEVAHVEGLMVVGGEALSNVISLGDVALLERVRDDRDPSRLEDAEHLRRNLFPDRERDLVEQVRAGDDVKLFVFERQIFRLRLHKLGPRDLTPCDRASELGKVEHVLLRHLKVIRRQIRGNRLDAGPIVFNKRMPPASAARDLEKFHLVLFFDSFEERDVLADRHEALPLHCVLRAGEQRLGRVLVRPRAPRRQPAVGLPVEVLQVVVRVLAQVSQEIPVVEQILVLPQWIVDDHDPAKRLCLPQQYLPPHLALSSLPLGSP
mmetsp:Transcript_33506/g.75207  ORF Transcript_33506/g.75207 Transcript_33506/m.75207 type:complete len:285 (-) Transcript_33506:1035-1889(-)